MTKIDAVLAATTSTDTLQPAVTKTLFDSTTTTTSKYIAAADVKFPTTVTVSGKSDSLSLSSTTGYPTGIEPYLRATLASTTTG